MLFTGIYKILKCIDLYLTISEAILMKFFNSLMLSSTTPNFIPLQKRRNVHRELTYQSESIQKAGSKIIDIIYQNDQSIILYQEFYECVPEIETDITLRLRIVTKKGILHPEPELLALYSDDFKKINIADIKIQKSMANTGYGSILLSQLIKIAEDRKIHSISGWISPIDEDHIERLIHFYEKNRFQVTLYQEHKTFKIGDLNWKNEHL